MIAEATKTTEHDPLAEIPGAPHGQKRKNGKSKDVDPNKVLAEEETKVSVDRQIRSIEITTKGRVKIGFVELIVYPIRKGEADNRKTTREYTVKSPDRPHPDLVSALKRLRKPALELCEIEVESKKLSDYTVSAVKIAGDMLLKQSRATLTIAKQVKRTDKVVHITTPEYTMYGDSDFDGAEALSKEVESVISEGWAYINGKFEEADPNQLPLFQVR